MKMDKEISEDIIKNTTKCINDFSCLNSGKECLCNVEKTAGVNHLFLKDDGSKKSACLYRMGFGDSFICNCPTRNEIYRRYQI